MLRSGRCHLSWKEGSFHHPAPNTYRCSPTTTTNRQPLADDHPSSSPTGRPTIAHSPSPTAHHPSSIAISSFAHSPSPTSHRPSSIAISSNAHRPSSIIHCHIVLRLSSPTHCPSPIVLRQALVIPRPSPFFRHPAPDRPPLIVLRPLPYHRERGSVWREAGDGERGVDERDRNNGEGGGERRVAKREGRWRWRERE